MTGWCPPASRILGATEWDLLERRAEAELLMGRSDALSLLHHLAQSSETELRKRATACIDGIARRTIPVMNDRWSIPLLCDVVRATSAEHSPVVDALLAEQSREVQEDVKSNWVSWQIAGSLHDFATLACFVAETRRAAVTDEAAFWRHVCHVIESWYGRDEWECDTEDWFRDERENVDDVHGGYETIRESMEMLLRCIANKPTESNAELADDIESAEWKAESMGAWCGCVDSIYQQKTARHPSDEDDDVFLYMPTVAAKYPSRQRPVSREVPRPLNVSTLFEDL